MTARPAVPGILRGGKSTPRLDVFLECDSAGCMDDRERLAVRNARQTEALGRANRALRAHRRALELAVAVVAKHDPDAAVRVARAADTSIRQALRVPPATRRDRSAS